MNKNFNKILVDGFRKSFENYSEPYDPDNWIKLKKRLLNIRRIRIIKYSLCAAASFSLIVMMIILYNTGSGSYNTVNLVKKKVWGSKTSKISVDSVSESAEIVEESKGETGRERIVSVNNNDFVFSIDGIKDIENKNKKNISAVRKGMFKESIISRKRLYQEEAVSEDIHDNFNRRVYIKPSLKKKDKIKFGFVFSTLVNRAEGDYDSEIGFAGGLISELPLISNLRLDLGFLVSKQSFGINREDIKFRETDVLGDAHSKKTNAELIALDIPVNIKYILSRKQDNIIFVSAGISSMAYFKENFNNTYYTENLSYNTNDFERTVTVTGQDNNSVKAFKRFDLAKVFNLSFGVGYKFRNGMNLQIEPFIKYPLGKLTSENIELGSGGIKFRVYF